MSADDLVEVKTRAPTRWTPIVAAALFAAAVAGVVLLSLASLAPGSTAASGTAAPVSEATPGGAQAPRVRVEATPASNGPELEAVLRLERRRAAFAANRPAEIEPGADAVVKYVSDVARVRRRLEGAVGFAETERARHALGLISIERQTVAFNAVAGVVVAAERDLRAIRPPNAAEQHHQRLTRVIRRYREALDLFAEVIVQLPPDDDTDRSRLVRSLLRASATDYRSVPDAPGPSAPS